MADGRPNVSHSSSSASTGPRVPERHSLDEDDVNWLDFLRNGGGIVTSTAAAAVERKRRHTGTSQERRHSTYNPSLSGRRPSGYTAASRPSGSSREHAIDLTQSPQSRLSTLPGGPERDDGAVIHREGVHRMGSESVHNPYQTPSTRDVRQDVYRRDQGLNPSNNRERDMRREIARSDNDIMTALWQPDSAVNKCPVCQTEFTFWYRKHHCRKCGRVVCAACSPHRITIPRQYIVHPPNTHEEFSTPSTQLASEIFSNPALGGGEIVRVCNPCVPDPWTPNVLPQQDQARMNLLANSATGDRNGILAQRANPLDVNRQRFGGPDLTADGQRRDMAAIRRSLDSGVQQSRALDFQRSQQQRRPVSYIPPPRDADQWRQGGGQSSGPHIQHHHRAVSSSTSTLPSASYLRHLASASVPTSAHAQPHTTPRRVREEDECPVCGCEMPEGEGLRETHVQECIATRFSSTPSQSSSLPPPGVLASSTGTPTILENAAASSPQNRPRAASYRPRGMAVYKATEKDCSNADGEPQECVICFEEFQPGDELGRMECLCKFHRLCIRQWWDAKGHGACPTHQLHE